MRHQRINEIEEKVKFYLFTGTYVYKNTPFAIVIIASSIIDAQNIVYDNYRCRTDFYEINEDYELVQIKANITEYGIKKIESIILKDMKYI